MEIAQSQRIHFDHFDVLPARRQILVAGKAVTLGARAFDLLLVLIDHREEVLGKDELMALVWPGMVVEENNLTVQISALRKVFGAAAIATVAGRGYRFVQPGLEIQELGAPALPTSAPAIPAPPVPRTGVPDGAAPEPGSTISVQPGLDRRKASANSEVHLALPEKPSIAVLPFANFSDETDLEHFTDGLTEDITTELSRFRSLFVISRNSAFTFKNRAVDVRTVARELGVRYVLEGSVRHSNERIRVTAQLIDAQSGNHIWAEKYDRVLADIFDVQEDVTRAIVGAIAPQIEHSDGNWARKARPENLAAYGLALRAWSMAHRDMLLPASPERDEAYTLAQQATKVDASAALAWRTIALIQWTRVYFNIAQSRSDALASGLEAANQAIRLDATDHIAMQWKGALLGLMGDEAGALAVYRAARTINRNYVLGLGFHGMYEAWAGNRELSVSHSLEAFRLSPLDPNRHFLLVLLGFTYFANRQYTEALEIAALAVHDAPDMPVPYLTQALSQIGLGRVEQAKQSFAKLQALAPQLVHARLAGQWLTTNAAYILRAQTFLEIAAGLKSPEAAEALR